jgi:2-polyprenyl-3-methyl-5-hydroxy-6-metoxy-1,4-benzoquinol methylase
LRTLEAKQLFKQAFRAAIQEKSAVLDEAAFPAYAHRNPLIDRIFWGRLAAAEGYLATRSLETVLDFGCGSGVMSYIVSGFAQRVVATDIEPASFNRMQGAVGFPRNIVFATVPELTSETYRRSFDAIIALDVLEHIEDLTGILRQFEKLLRPSGVVVISGPTESALYRLGRWIAGERFTGDYHVSNIRKVEAECRRHGSVHPIATLYPVLPLFKVFSLQFGEQQTQIRH